MPSSLSHPNCATKEELDLNRQQLLDAFQAEDHDRIKACIRSNPSLLDEQMPNADRGGPLSLAAQRGWTELAEWLIEQGSRDIQQALSRSAMKGHRETAALLVRRGADPNGLYAEGREAYGPVIFAACESLNDDGIRLLIELGADPAFIYALPDGTTQSALGMILGGYLRDPIRKHRCLDALAQAGVAIPQTPVMALHRGQVAELEKHIDEQPGLLEQTFTTSELMAPELGFHNAMALMPLEGCTLLHLAMEYDEFEIADLLIRRGANVNARADATADGPTPLFHAVVACLAPTDARTGFLLARGADPSIRATVRHPDDGWEELAGQTFRNVTALEYAKLFESAPEWLNRKSIRLLEAKT